MSAVTEFVATPKTRRPWRPFASLPPADRRLLLTCLGIVLVLIVVLAFLAPQEDEADHTPSTFASGTHGAEAAYLALADSGYRIERWEESLDRLAEKSDEHTVLILAGPNFNPNPPRAAIAKILEHGGRVLATGLVGAALLPEDHAEPTPTDLTECEARPEASEGWSGNIFIHPTARWKLTQPAPGQHVAYACNGNAVVVRYAVGKGEVVWWASSLPLENAGITRGDNLALLVGSIGLSDGAHIFWDESLHGEKPGVWSYAEGTPVHLLWAQLGLIAFLLVLSYSRRSGPLLPDPIIARDTQFEFVHSLGALYNKAGATNTVVGIAYDRFRLMLGRPIGAPNAESSPTERAAEIATQVTTRLGRTEPGLLPTVTACEESIYESQPMPPRRALALSRSLWQYEREIRQGTTTSKEKE